MQYSCDVLVHTGVALTNMPVVGVTNVEAGTVAESDGPTTP